MLAIRAYYKDGRISLIEPIPKEIKEAILNIVIIPKDSAANKEDWFEVIDKKGKSHKLKDWTDEEWAEFSLINFFDENDNTKVEDLFDV